MPRREAAYTHGHHDTVVAKHAVRTAESSAAYLLAHLRPGMSVLDVRRRLGRHLLLRHARGAPPVGGPAGRAGAPVGAGEQAAALGLARPADLGRLAEAWLRWAAAEDGWFVVHGQVRARRGVAPGPDTAAN